jgi:transposase-like protein
MTKIGGLSAKQRVAAAMLAGGATGRDTASKVGVSEDTVSRWRRIPEFQSVVVQLIRGAEEAALERLHALRLGAVERLGELIASKNEIVALRAITEVLDRTTAPIPNVGATSTTQRSAAERFMHALAANLMAHAHGSAKKAGGDSYHNNNEKEEIQ